jgi:phage gp36-like protein
VEKDRSNGENSAGDGRILKLDGTTFSKGLGVHGTSDVRYTVPSGCTRFDSVVGVDDEVVVDGSVVFQVLQDATKLYDSGLRRFDSPNTNVSIPVVPGSVLRLLVTDGGNGASNDHADWADARFTCTPTTSQTPSTAARHVSDLVPVSQTNGWGPVEKDRSNGENSAGDGRILKLDGTTFSKGLGVHGTSDVRYTIPSGCTRFDAVVGVDDEVVVDGSVVFQVLQDATKLYDSGLRRFDSPNTNVSIPVVPGRVLRLLVTDGGNGASNDHADWADARFTCTTSGPAVAPVPPPTTAPARPAVRPVVPEPTTAPAVPSGRDFGAATALWNPIPANPRLDATSEAVRLKVAESGASRVALLYEFGNKIYTADATTPRYKLNIVNAGVDKWGDNDLAYETVPIPDGAVPGTGTDGKLVIVDYSRRRVYDLWQVTRSGSTWNVSWGGVYDLDGDGSSRNPAYGTGQWGVAWPKPLSRGTGSGMSTLAGTVKMSEIKAGVIPHALVFATDITCGPAQTGQFRWPATTTDGSRTSGTCIPEGARLQLDPSIDLTKIPGITKAELALGRALQTYGAYATDGGGSRISIGFEAPKEGDENPYPAAGLTWDYFGLNRLPWASVRMLASWNGA